LPFFFSSALNSAALNSTLFDALGIFADRTERGDRWPTLPPPWLGATLTKHQFVTPTS